MKVKHVFFLLAVILIQLPINAQDTLEEQKTIQQLKILPLRDGAFDSFLSLMKINITESKKEDGVLNSLLYRQQSNAKTMILFERFKNQEDFEAHNDKVYARSTNGIAPAATALQLETIQLIEIPEISNKTIKNTPNLSDHGVYTIYNIKNEMQPIFIEAVKKLVHDTSEQENTIFSIFQNKENANEFILFEQWASDEALESFKENIAFKDFNSSIKPILNSEDRQVLEAISE